MLYSRAAMLCAPLILTAVVAAVAADNNSGAVEQTGGNNVRQNPSLPKLNLTNAQREEVRNILLKRNTQIEFRTKETKPAAGFEPKIGAKLPAAIKPTGIPGELRQQIPQLADYGYARLKDQILLVNAMTGKIAEIIPETPPQTTGQKAPGELP
jgi:hypothetical protein